MRTSWRIAAGAFLAALWSSGAVAAEGRAQQRGTIAVAFDPSGVTASTRVAGFEEFHVYIVGYELGDISAFEVGEGGDWGEFTVLATTFSEPGALHIGHPGYVVGLGTCAHYVDPTPLVSLRAIYTQATGDIVDDLLCLGPFPISSVDPPAPAFVDCYTQLWSMGYANLGGPDYPDRCAVVNPTQLPPIGLERQSFGELKVGGGR